MTHVWNHLKTVVGDELKRERGGLRAWVPSNPVYERGGPFGLRNRKPPVAGLISVTRVWNHLKTVVGGELKRERGGLRA